MSASKSDWTDTVANAGLTLAADTVGVLWSAVSGTVDPFTKAQQVNAEANALLDAGGNPATGVSQAEKDVAAGYGDADPENFWAGVGQSWSLQNLASKIPALPSSASQVFLFVAIAAVAILLLYGLFIFRQVRV
jgi:hypothetical protein